MDRNDLITIAQRLREYVGNPHHVDPMSDAFKMLIGEASEALSQAAQLQGDPVAWINLHQVLRAYEYAESHPHKYLRCTTNWCAAVAHSLNAEQPAPVAVDDQPASDHQFYTAQLQTRAAKVLGLDPENTSWFEVVGEMEKAAQTAPVAVVSKFCMRSVMEIVEALRLPVMTSNQCHALAMRLNACLDEVTRLNPGAKP